MIVGIIRFILNVQSSTFRSAYKLATLAQCVPRNPADPYPI